MRHPFKFINAVGLGLVTLLAAPGCSAPSSNPSPTEQATTLRIATDDTSDRPAGAQIEEFARQAKELSGGKVLIEPVWKAVGEDTDDWDQAVARKVIAGDFDMGLIPARAWDTEGVSSFAALHAPFLVTSNSLLAKVADPAVADEMLGELDKVGVSGLALFPESTRMLFSFRGPALKPADLFFFFFFTRKKARRAPRSDTTYALLSALGATADDLGKALPEGVAAERWWLLSHRSHWRGHCRNLPQSPVT